RDASRGGGQPAGQCGCGPYGRTGNSASGTGDHCTFPLCGHPPPTCPWPWGRSGGRCSRSGTAPPEWSDRNGTPGLHGPGGHRQRCGIGGGRRGSGVPPVVDTAELIEPAPAAGG
ncbi:unnamed protein product, partial [Discosporangium mesarthrocarpum]